PIDIDAGYERLADAGYGYGPAFRGLTGAWRRGTGELLAAVELPDGLAATGFGVHPALLDAALHPLLLDAESDRLRLPFAAGGAWLGASGATRLRVRLAVDGEDVAVLAADESGNPVAGIETLRVREMAAGALAA